MKGKRVLLNACLSFPDGRVAQGRNGWFRPVAVQLTQNDAGFTMLAVESIAGAPITIWFNAADASRVGEALISITAGGEQHD